MTRSLVHHFLFSEKFIPNLLYYLYVLWWEYWLTVVVITVECGVWHFFQSHQLLRWRLVHIILSMNAAGRPHFHVPWPAFVLCWLSRRATATLFVNLLTLITIVSIASEERSVVHAKVVLHTSYSAVSQHDHRWWWDRSLVASDGISR
jgi:hypothetical protein